VPDLPTTNSNLAPAFELNNCPGLTWTADLPAALAWAAQHNALVFLEFDGVTDANGAINHSRVFTQLSIRLELRRFVRVILYEDILLTHFYKNPPGDDERQADAARNYEFQMKQFHTVATPFFAILQPCANDQFRVVEVHEVGVIRDNKDFLAFLKRH
jgi:hypothetical protein